MTINTPGGGNEPLLEIYRKLSDKEKLAWVRETLRELSNKYEKLKQQNVNLTKKNQKLQDKINRDSIQYPSQLNGQSFVSVKAYFKLQERYKELDKRFWEMVQELNQLKKEEKL